MPPLPPERDADEPDFLELPDEVLRDEVDALFAADRVRPAPPDFEAPELFLADDFALDFEPPDFEAPPRAGERAADFADVLLDAALFAAVLLLVAPDFAALFFAPDFDALFFALEPELFAPDFLLPELEPDLRDFVVLSAMLASFRRFA
jgi:hypothetical protein